MKGMENKRDKTDEMVEMDKKRWNRRNEWYKLNGSMNGMHGMNMKYFENAY